MRKLLLIESFDENNMSEKIKEVINNLCNYLDCFSVTRTTSKHSLMGPIAKIIDLAKNKNNSADYIKSRALRMHEMKSNSGYISSNSINLLENSVESLLEFRDNLTPVLLRKTLEKINYEVYFKKRKQDIEYFENIRNEFIKYLKDEYADNIENLKSHTNLSDWKDVKYPTKNGEFFNKANQELKEKIKNFWENRKELENKIIDEEE